jgi:hypothetical protein
VIWVLLAALDQRVPAHDPTTVAAGLPGRRSVTRGVRSGHLDVKSEGLARAQSNYALATAGMGGYRMVVPRGIRRTLAKITPQDQSTKGRSTGPRWLAGYGLGYASAIGRLQRRKTALETMRRGIPLDNPIVLVAWGLARLGEAETARAVLRAYKLDNRFIVRRKTLALRTQFTIGPTATP